MAIPELNEITSIEIFAQWFGLGTPSSSDYEIVARDGAFFGGLASIDPIDPQNIVALLLSLHAPPVHSPDPTNMGFSPEWLEFNLEQAIEDNLGAYSRQGKRRLQELLRNFDDFSEFVKSQFTCRWTDDSPFVRVRIYSHTCAPVDVRSSSQYSFMIPWNVTTLEGGATTHNARIGRAVAELLPKGFSEKSRLNGDELIPRIFYLLSGDDALLDRPATVLCGHHRAISTLLVTRDQKYLISGGWDDKVNVWDTQTWTKRFEFDAPREGVNLAVALGADDATLAFNDSFLINLADLNAGQITHQVDGHSWVVLNLVFSHDGKLLASEDSDKLVVWEVARMCQQACFPGEHVIGFSFDDAQLFTRAQESLLARDTRTFESTVFAGQCKLACVSRQGTKLAWVNSQSILHVWDLNCNRELLQYTLLSPPTSLEFADTDELLGCATADGELLILNILEQRIRLMPSVAGARTADFTFSPDARHVAALQDQDIVHAQRLTAWEVVSGRNLLNVHTTRSNCVIMLPDGKMVVTGHWDGSIKVWPVAFRKAFAAG